MKTKRLYPLFKETITIDNIEKMSQLIAVCQTKSLTKLIGTPMVRIHRSLIRDIYNKNRLGYALSDSYEYVQEIGLYLIGKIGNKLNDTDHIDKKGKTITIQHQAIKIMTRIISRQMRDLRRNKDIEILKVTCEQTKPKDQLAKEKSYEKVEKIIESLNLNDTQQKALECRMNGMSYPEIAKVIQRAISTTYDCLRAVEKRYKALYR